ncbi:AraC family transcriptional regulator [Geomonas silvestris]|uniref:AraC family transcriptional regulator n=1 Tax=Geomonas silvestris TaxID=2740184 RepID=A0A6V8MKN5_9BACT|nr:AraC family transcriptional regulator [Geomonas silvestris]GFO60546.1 AraC family transcriptional regulator [Geomonas silvestris]
MDEVTLTPSAEEQRLAAALSELTRSIARWTEKGERHDTAVPGLSLFRREAPTEPACGIYEPSLCMVTQGAKRVFLGDDCYVYDPHNYLITSVHLPTLVQIHEASAEKPYLGLRLTFDLREISQLMADSKVPPPHPQSSSRGMATGRNTPALVGAVQRLVDLLDDEKDIPVLAPIIQREIIYRLLVGEQGARLRQIAVAGSQSQQIARAIEWLKGNFTKSFRIDDLAAQARMSTSTFHHHFRSMTAFSPLQYQKNLRLQEARRLMLAEHLDAASAAFNVGYESPSQFSREYNRLFGAPPLRDISNLRRSVVVGQPQ